MKLKLLIAVAVMAISLTGCATAAQQISDLVEDSIEQADQLSEDEWAERDRQIAELLQEYKENPDSFSEEEIHEIDRALGQYLGARLKQGLGEATDALEEFLNRLPSFVEGFMDAFDLPQTEEDDKTSL